MTLTFADLAEMSAGIVGYGAACLLTGAVLGYFLGRSTVSSEEARSGQGPGP